MHDDPTPLHKSKDISSGWITDELGWDDVYSKKPVEYLESIARGETPRWDTDAGKYIYSNNQEEEISMGGSVKSEVKKADPQSNQEVDEDLPF